MKPPKRNYYGAYGYRFSVPHWPKTQRNIKDETFIIDCLIRTPQKLKSSVYSQ